MPNASLGSFHVGSGMTAACDYVLHSSLVAVLPGCGGEGEEHERREIAALFGLAAQEMHDDRHGDCRGPGHIRRVKQCHYSIH